MPLRLVSISVVAILAAVACADPDAARSGGGGAPSPAGAGGDDVGASSTTSGGAGGAPGSGGHAGSGGAIDPCAGPPPACPGAPPADYAEGDGLLAIDRCAFPMEDRDDWAHHEALVDLLAASLPVLDLGGVLDDANRAAVPVAPASLPGDPPDVTTAFAWEPGDESVEYWIPQGLTGSGDGVEGGEVAGRKVLLVSWYYEQASDPGSAADKGVRLAVVDATDPAAIAYRFVLLVEPVERRGGASFGPVSIHAGGIAWFGDLLYVADTAVGFRVFDLRRFLQVDTSVDAIGYDPATDDYHAHGYKYVLPQVDTFAHVSACAPVFSFVSLDRSTSPPSLVSGEYDAGSIEGRLFRWPLDPGTGRLAGAPVVPAAAYLAGQSHVQGALATGGTFWLSSSAPPGSGGALYRTAEGVPSVTYGWIDAPEDLSFDPTTGALWGLSEGLDHRYVFSVPLASVAGGG